MKNRDFSSLLSNEQLANSQRSLLSVTLDFFQQAPLLISGYLQQKLPTTFLVVKRSSPLLFLSIALPFLMAFAKSESNLFVQFCILLFLEINTVYIDFALRNYFRGKKRTNLWLIEIPIAAVILFFIL